VSQAAGAKRLDLFVQPRADPRDLRLGHPGLHAHRGDQVIDTAGRHPVHVGLHDHRMQRPIDAPTPLQQRREERTGPQLGDLHLDITGGGRHRLGSVPVAVGATPAGALIAARADRLGGLGLDQRLQPSADQLSEHRPSIGGLQRIELSKQGRMILGHRVVCPFRESLWSVTH
jgi:hypothetical protein